MDTIFDQEEYFDIEPYRRLFKVQNHPRFPHKIIVSTDGKEVPDDLKDLWVNTTDANHAINKYLAKIKQQAIEHAKNKKRRDNAVKKRDLDAKVEEPKEDEPSKDA